MDSPYPPKPTEEKVVYRLLLGHNGIVMSFYDWTVEPGFNPGLLMANVKGCGYFMPADLSVWIPADAILGVARVFNSENPKDGKVLPFAVVPKVPPADMVPPQ